MNKFNKLNDIPATEADFNIEIEGTVTKKRFVGEFNCKIPRIKETCLIDKHRAFLNGPQPEHLSAATLTFHHMISYLRYTLDDKNCPRWWKESDLGYELYDDNVVKAIYDQVLNFEVEWLKQVWGEEAVNKLQSRNKEADDDLEPKQKEEADAKA